MARVLGSLLRSRRSAILAVVLGIGLGVPAAVIANHRHTYALWDHGLMVDTASNGVLVSHPALISTDGAHRNSCVAHAVDGNHGTIYCRLTNHNHVNTTVPSNYWDQSAHTESSQTSLSHHHHFPH